jgi:hypothetical protein
MKSLKLLILFVLLQATVSCGTNLFEETLNVALIDEVYTYELEVDESGWDWLDWSNETFLFAVTEGSLPSGVVLATSGTLSGTPTEVGNFEFRIAAYEVDQGWGDDDVSSDREWFTLFVTEASTNEDCPLPTTRDTIENYLCLGDIEAETLTADESFDLDINYYTNVDEAEGYNIKTISFAITYDTDYFVLDEDELTSQILREAATRSEATISFDNSVAGTLIITLLGTSKSFHKPGRLIDLPFYAIQDVPAGEYAFGLTITALISDNDDQDLPDSFEVDGSITVESDVEEESEDL